MANSVDPDETAHYEPTHQDLHCLHSYLVWSAGLKWLMQIISDVKAIAGTCSQKHELIKTNAQKAFSFSHMWWGPSILL